MNRKDIISLWKIVPILSAFAFSLLLFVCCFFVNGTISALPYFASYFDAGKSMFLPFIPRINVLFFLPEEAQVIPFTFGHLLDFIILVNLTMVINPVTLPFFKKVSQEYQNNLYYDLHLGNTHQRQKPLFALLDANRVILLDRHEVLDHPSEAGLKHACVRTGMRPRRSYDDEAENVYAGWIVARTIVKFSKPIHRQDREPSTTRVLSLYRFRERLSGLDVSIARFYVARAVITSFFASRTIFVMRYRL